MKPLPRGARARWLGTFVLCLLPVAASSYAYAWLVTGNPLFPFYNAVFRSPYYPLENFRDLKWMAGVSWRSLWDITFKTNAYGQFFPGAAGLAVLATLPALIVDAGRRPQPRWLALLNGETEYIRPIPEEFANLAVPGGKLAPNLARKGYQLARDEIAYITYTTFNTQEKIEGRPNPVGGFYGQKTGMRGRFGVYVPPALVAQGRAEIAIENRKARIRAL